MQTPNYEKISVAIRQYRVATQKPVAKTLMDVFPHRAFGRVLHDILKEKNYLRFVDTKDKKSFYQWIRKEEISEKEIREIYDEMIKRLKKNMIKTRNQTMQSKYENSSSIENLKLRISEIRKKESELQALREVLAKEMASYVDLVSEYNSL